MNPGDRIKLVSIRPQYLEGVLGTVVREQPGEDRVLVRIDNDPKARKYAGGEWCVQKFTVRPDDSENELDKLIREQIDPAAKRAAETWIRDIAPIVEEAASSWGFAKAPEFLGERWEELYKPALLWRFYWHLANELRLIAEGHETVLFQSLREGDR